MRDGGKSERASGRWGLEKEERGGKRKGGMRVSVRERKRDGGGLERRGERVCVFVCMRVCVALRVFKAHPGTE